MDAQTLSLAEAQRRLPSERRKHVLEQLHAVYPLVEARRWEKSPVLRPTGTGASADKPDPVGETVVDLRRSDLSDAWMRVEKALREHVSTDRLIELYDDVVRRIARYDGEPAA